MKELFFTALVAVVAVGGAYANYGIGSEVDAYSCPAGLTTCDIKYGNVLVSDEPASQGQENQYYLSTISWDGFN